MTEQEHVRNVKLVGLMETTEQDFSMRKSSS